MPSDSTIWELRKSIFGIFGIKNLSRLDSRDMWHSLLFSPKKWDLVGLIFFIFLAAIKMTREGAKNMWAHKTSLPGWDCHMAPPTILFLWERVVKILHLKWRNSFHKSVFLALLTTTHYIFKQQYCSVMHELWAKKVFKSDMIFHP